MRKMEGESGNSRMHEFSRSKVVGMGGFLGSLFLEFSGTPSLIGIK